MIIGGLKNKPILAYPWILINTLDTLIEIVICCRKYTGVDESEDDELKKINEESGLSGDLGLTEKEGMSNIGILFTATSNTLDLLFFVYSALICFNSFKMIISQTDLEQYATLINLIELVIRTILLQIPVLCLLSVHVFHMYKIELPLDINKEQQ